MNQGKPSNPIGGTRAAGSCLRAASLAATLIAVGTARAEDWDTPQARLRPIGSPSAVDAYNPRRNASQPAGSANQRLQASQSLGSSDSYVRQAAMMQATTDGFSMPADSLPRGISNGTPSPPASMPAPLTQSPGLGPIALPQAAFDNTPLPRPATTTPPPRSSTPIAGAAPQAAPPPGMAPVPRSAPPATAVQPSGDDAPLAQPQLSSAFATMGNCRNITPPSGYRADRILTCGPPVSYVTTVGASAPPPTYLAPPAHLGPPVTLPPGAVPADAFTLAPVQTVIPGSSGHRPLISFGQERYPVQVGQGMFGQPTAYVPGQSFRNAIRYLTW